MSALRRVRRAVEQVELSGSAARPEASLGQGAAGLREPCVAVTGVEHFDQADGVVRAASKERGDRARRPLPRLRQVVDLQIGGRQVIVTASADAWASIAITPPLIVPKLLRT